MPSQQKSSLKRREMLSWLGAGSTALAGCSSSRQLSSELAIIQGFIDFQDIAKRMVDKRVHSCMDQMNGEIRFALTLYHPHLVVKVVVAEEFMAAEIERKHRIVSGLAGQIKAESDTIYYVKEWFPPKTEINRGPSRRETRQKEQCK